MLQKLPIINQQNFYCSWYCIKGALSLFLLAVWEHGIEQQWQRGKKLGTLEFLIQSSVFFISSSLFCHVTFLSFSETLNRTVESKMMLFTFKEARRELFQGSACDELNHLHFFCSGRGSRRRLFLQGLPFKPLYRWLSQCYATRIAIVLNSTFKKKFSIPIDVLAKLRQFQHCSGRSVL